MKDLSIVDVLIENIKVDQKLLEESEAKIEKAKVEKRNLISRLKDYRKDVSVLLKYADDSRMKQIEELGIELTDSSNGLNSTASLVLDLIMKAKENQLTNGALYETYCNSIKNEHDRLSYTEFNIKCRSLFNTQRLLRKKGKNPKSSRDDIISLNGKLE